MDRPQKRSAKSAQLEAELKAKKRSSSSAADILALVLKDERTPRKFKSVRIVYEETDTGKIVPDSCSVLTEGWRPFREESKEVKWAKDLNRMYSVLNRRYYLEYSESKKHM